MKGKKPNQMFQVESDLHLEFSPHITENNMRNFLPKTTAKFLLLAGDICPIPTHQETYNKVIAYCSSQWEHVFIVAGNHEYYNKSKGIKLTVQECNKVIISICEMHNNVHFLQKNTFYLEEHNIMILGTTLWSNTLHPIPLNDYNLIRHKDKIITYKDTQEWFSHESTWLTETIAQYKDKHTLLVLTHHMPSFALIAKQYEFSPVNIGFASNLDHLLAQVKHWVCGHTHAVTQTIIEGCNVYINPRGYPGECSYKPMLFDA